MKADKYSYSWSQKMFTYLPTLVLTGLSLFSITVSIVSLVRWIMGNAPTYIGLRDIIGGSIGIAIIATVCGFMATLFANAQPNVRVSDQGLEVQIFLIWWRLIPWEDIKDIRPILMIKRCRLVIVRKLTFIHRFIGTMYFAFFQPAFLIGSEIDNYDELVHLIKKKIGKELWE